MVCQWPRRKRIQIISGLFNRNTHTFKIPNLLRIELIKVSIQYRQKSNTISRSRSRPWTYLSRFKKCCERRTANTHTTPKCGIIQITPLACLLSLSLSLFNLIKYRMGRITDRIRNGLGIRIYLFEWTNIRSSKTPLKTMFERRLYACVCVCV